VGPNQAIKWGHVGPSNSQGIAEINAAPVVHRWKNFKALEQD
jgi:hypothetical protein